MILVLLQKEYSTLKLTTLAGVVMKVNKNWFDVVYLSIILTCQNFARCLIRT